MIGVDEVGRGSWAGPLVVCAVRLHSHIEGLADSKQLSKKRRIALYEIIENSADIGLGWVSAEEIDDIGLSAALKLAAAKALAEIDPNDNEDIIVDGTVSFYPDKPTEKTLIKADTKIPCVSAASIAAKVLRDQRMEEIDRLYKQYNFAANVGYGTLAHKEAIEQWGYLYLHRQSFALPKPGSGTV